MSSLASINAFRGYTYQYQVFCLFLIKMDYDRNIIKVKAENFVDNHNFDDIIIETNNNSVYIQVKNMIVTKENFKIENNYVTLNNQKIKYNPDLKNILIVNKIDIENNCEFMGVKCYKEGNIFICSLSVDDIYNSIESLNIEENRILQLLRLSSTICANNCEINILDLPKFNFYNTELQEKTLEIRNNILNFKDNTVNYIIGKPGIGKSHFAKELKIDNSILYRFWIGENDINKNDRLQYNNFIRDISYKIFDCSHVKEEIEILNKLKKDGKVLIIDGLDHVENYNCSEIEKYFYFINMLEKNNIHSIILSRPLRHEIVGNIIELQNWNKSQTKEFINKKYSILDYSLEEQIYNISKGYPIIVDFLCKEYLLNNEIRPFPQISDLNTYFDTLISESDVKGLYVFSKCKCFLTQQELKSLLDSYGWDTFQEFFNRNKFLFCVEKNRISLIHDSLNLYINTKLPQYQVIDDKIKSLVVNSMMNNEINFFARFQSFELDNDTKLSIIKKYLNIDVFKYVLYNNLDYESIRSFYKIIPNEMIKFSSSKFTELEYLQLSIIESIVARNHIEQSFDLLIPLFNYLKTHKPNSYNTDIYSSGTLYSLQDFNLKKYERYIDEGFYDLDQVLHAYNEAQYKYVLYLKRIEKGNFDTSKIDFKAIPQCGDYWAIENISAIMCQSYLIKKDFLDSKNFVTYCATDSPKYYPIAIKILEQFNINPNQRNVENLKDSVKDVIFQYDTFKDINYYEQKTLKEIIREHSHEGSFTLYSYIVGYLRHAIMCNKDIDIESISLYWGMFYQRKDYSLDDIQTILNVLKHHHYINLQECCNLINTCQNMTEKSYRDNFNTFLNNLSFDELKIFIKTNDLYKYRINISQLKPEIINILPQPFVYKQIFEIILGYNINNIHTSIEYYNIENILKSNYKDVIIKLMRDHEITIYYAPKDLVIKDISIVNNREEYIIGSQFDSGYAYYKDKDYIKEKGINHLDLAKMIDGYLYRLPYANLFYNFEENIIKKDIKSILFNALCLNNYKYFDFYLYNMSISSIIELFEYFNINVSWDKVNKIFNCFFDISLIH